MEEKLRIFNFIIAIITGVILIVSIIADLRPSISFGLDGWATIIPFFIILIVLPIFMIIKEPKLKSWLNFLINGAIIGGGIWSILTLVTLLPRLSLIIADGTAYWGYVSLPIVIIGYPLILIGAIIGSIVGLIIQKIKSKK